MEIKRILQIKRHTCCPTNPVSLGFFHVNYISNTNYFVWYTRKYHHTRDSLWMRNLVLQRVLITSKANSSQWTYWRRYQQQRQMLIQLNIDKYFASSASSYFQVLKNRIVNTRVLIIENSIELDWVEPKVWLIWEFNILIEQYILIKSYQNLPRQD